MGIKNSTAPVPVEITKSEVIELQGATTTTINTTPLVFLNDGNISEESSPEPEIHTEKSNLHKIVHTFGKLRPISTLVLKNTIPERGEELEKQKLLFEIYETLNETLLYTAEKEVQNWSVCCFGWHMNPIVMYDNFNGNEIAKLTFSSRLTENHRIQVIEISCQDIIIGYIQAVTVTAKAYSHEILDEKYVTIFSVERKTLGFRCLEYKVQSVSSIEVSVCVATVRTPREGKVFTEMHSSLSATFKALLMSFSLYLLTLNE